jgi:hypothetical protein
MAKGFGKPKFSMQTKFTKMPKGMSAKAFGPPLNKAAESVFNKKGKKGGK